MKTPICCPKCGLLDYIKKGYYKTKFNHQPVPRYKCKGCNTNFSSHSNRETYGQHRPDINQEIFTLSSMSVTMRDMARKIGCSRTTIARKIEFIAEKAKTFRENLILETSQNPKSEKSNFVLFDEMETYQHTKCQPLSIALAVDNSTGLIVDAQVAYMKCKGKLASFSQAKYPNWTKDTRESACEKVIKSVSMISNSNVIIGSDEKKSYPNIIRSIIPNAKIATAKRDKKANIKSTTSDGVALKKDQHFDPLFMLNQRAAKIRAILARMRRRTWDTTKLAQNLQMHLDIYIAYHNKYDLKLNWC